MATSIAGILCSILALSTAISAMAATVHTVGDSAGWALGTDYSTWNSDKTIVIGDSLAFNYGSGHTVDEVKESDYKSCTVGNSITSDSSGATTITLKTAGTHYFICGIPGHCTGGMKVAVTVAAAAGAPTAPSTTPSSTTTPSSSSGTTTTPQTTTPIVDPTYSSSVSVTMSVFVSFIGLILLGIC